MPKIEADTEYPDLAVDALAAVAQANRGSAARTRCENKVVADYAKAR